MKKLIIIIAAIISFSFIENETKAMHGGYFYSELSSYGTWIELDYGVLAWRPIIMRTNWAPYSQGRWIWTDCGWYWDSYEPFGYIVFHYGRWYYDDYYGWMWIPDNEWAPAWVEWRYDDAYIGWAPLSPYASFSISVGIYFTTNYYVPYSHWHFVRYNHFCNSHVYNYYVGPKYKYRIYSRTKIRTNYDYYNGRVRNRGVDLRYVETRSGQKIRQRDIIRESDPGKYRSEVKNSRDRIVTFDAGRDVLKRDNVRDLKVERNTGRSTLNLSKVELKSRGNINQNREVIRNSNDTKVRKEVNTRQNDVQKRTEVNRNTKVQKENKNTQRDVNREKKVEIKRNTDTQREVKINRNQNNTNRDVQIKKQNTQTRTNTVTKNNNTRNQKTEVRKQTTVKRNTSNTSRETKTNTRNNSRTQDTRKNTSSEKENKSRRR